MNRDRILDKIRGLLSKTVSNGCTEAEAMWSQVKYQGYKPIVDCDGALIGTARSKIGAAKATLLSAHGTYTNQEIKELVARRIKERTDCFVISIAQERLHFSRPMVIPRAHRLSPAPCARHFRWWDAPLL